ncbi:Phage integrase family protein [Pseudomonas agarici]|nr:Phage integrase family protein [Pseudomonas agarici]
MSENTVNTMLRNAGYDTSKDVCGHGFRTMACSALLESGLWTDAAIERQMSHKERNRVRAAYIHKAEFLEQRRLIMAWWSNYIDANRHGHVTPHEFAHPVGDNITALQNSRGASKRG